VVLLVIGISALIAQRGLLSPLRVMLVDDLAIDFGPAGSQAIPDAIALWLGSGYALLASIVIPLTLLGYVYADPSFRGEPNRSLPGVAIGGVIAFGWLATSLVSRAPARSSRCSSKPARSSCPSVICCCNSSRSRALFRTTASGWSWARSSVPRWPPGNETTFVGKPATTPASLAAICWVPR
jgi:hypothetical protein